MATQWFIKLGDQSAGPFSAAQIKEMASSGQLTPSSLICREADNSPDGQWVEASRVKGLFESQAPKASRTEGSEESASPAAPEVNISTAGRTSVSLSRKYGTRTPTKPQDVIYVVLGLFCCFPIGLYLLWTRNWKTNTKVIITAVCVLLIVIGMRSDMGSREADRLNSPVRSAPTSADVREEAWALVKAKEQKKMTDPQLQHVRHVLEASPSMFSVKEMGNNTFRVEGKYTQYLSVGLKGAFGDPNHRSKYETTKFVAIVSRSSSGKWILRAFNPPESKTKPQKSKPRTTPPPKEPDARPPLPDFEIGGLRDQDKPTSTPARAAPGTIGKWRDSVIGIVSIIQESGTYYLVFHSDGSRLSLQAAPSPQGRKFIRPGSASGDYYMINAQGNLESWDSQGLIDTARRL